MNSARRIARVASITGCALGLLVPQWVVAARYRVPRDPRAGSVEFEVAVERRVLEDHVDLPGEPASEGRAVLPVEGAAGAADLDLVAEPGQPVSSGQVLAYAPHRDAEGTLTRHALFLLTCPSSGGADVQPGGSSDLVGCLQMTMALDGARLDRAEVAERRLGATTQAALADRYRRAGVDPPVTEDDLEIKRLDAEATVVTARAAVAAAAPGDAAGAEAARLRLLAATLRRDQLRDRSGVRLVAADLLVAPVGDLRFAGVVAGDGDGDGADGVTGAAVAVTWGRPVVVVDVPSATWPDVAGAVEHRLVGGETSTPLAVVSVTPGPDGSRHVVLDASGSSGGPVTVRFVVATSTAPVVSVPTVAVRRDGPTAFVVVRSGRRRRRIGVREVGAIGGRSILADDGALAGVHDVVVG